MRRYSDTEKDTIKRIISDSSNLTYVLVNAYNDIFYAKKVEYQYKGGGKLIFYKKDITDFAVNELFEIENEILEVSLLLNHLEREGLIYLIEDSSDNNKLDIIGGFPTENLVPVGKSLDTNINEILHRSCNHRVFVNQTLKDLAMNDFKTVEDMTLEKACIQTELAWGAVICSVITMVLSLIAICH